MIKLLFKTNSGDKEITTDKGKSILEIMRLNGIDLEAPCGGKGVCGKCKVMIDTGNDENWSEEELKFFSNKELKNGWRLACIYRPKNNVVINIKEQNQNKFSFLKEDIGVFEDISPSLLINNKEKTYGIAVDIGTTTVVASLFSFKTGNVVKEEYAINPQKTYGLDVLSRIEYQNRGTKELIEIQNKIVNCIDELGFNLSKKANINIKDIGAMTIAGNTSMLHFLLGLSAISLGKYPYKSLVKGSVVNTFKEMGFKNLKQGRVYILPPIKGFIGSDISAGILISGLDKKNQNTLFIDIGTNGEMVLKTKDKMVCCSCAAGPAFEGANISCGMRAETGAIEFLKIKEDGNIESKTIGNNKAVGICGSAILDVLGELAKAKLIGKTGRLKKPELLDGNIKKLIGEHNGKRYFEIKRDDKNFRLYQSDLRQIQLAKGAIRSGIEAMLLNLNIKSIDVEEVIIAGQFGKHLRVESLISAGLLPKELESKVTYIGNSSKAGAIACLSHEKWRLNIENIVKDIEYIELSKLEGYDRLFAECLKF